MAGYLKDAGSNIVIEDRGSSGSAANGSATTTNGSGTKAMPSDVSQSVSGGQSPIDICCSNVESNCLSLSQITYHYQADDQVTLTNNGYSPTWTVSPGKHYITGGPTAGIEYELVQFHIHFAKDRLQGSEHTINGKAYPAEIHFVHYKREYGSLGEAVKHCDGLMVLGFFLDIDNVFYHRVFNDDLQRLEQVKENGASITVSLALDEYKLDGDKYFNYCGSLTTPGYDECVVWINMIRPLYVSAQALGLMQSLESSSGGLVVDHGNFRELQPLNGRPIRASFNVMGDLSAQL